MRASRFPAPSSSWLAYALFALGAAPAVAVPLVVTDVTYVHSAETTQDSHFYAPLADGVPVNLRAPVDYASGSAVVRLEVRSKPSDTPTRFQVCFEAQQSYGCTFQSPAYAEVGVYTWETPFSDFWSPSPVDWSQGIRDVALILKDTANGKPAPENVGPTVSALYMPTELRVTVTLVPPGETYTPPADMDGDAPLDGGPLLDASGSLDAGPNDASEDAGPAADADRAEDAGASLPEEADAGLDVVDAGSDGGERDASSGDAGDVAAEGADGGARDAPPDADAGSDDHQLRKESPSPTWGCSSTSSAPSAALLLGGLWLWLRRRRR